MQGGVSVSAPEFADLNLSIPPLHRWLDAVIGASPEDSVAPHHGPRRWWPGPLDVEGLALGALQAVATALHRYPAGRARFSVTSAPVAASFNSLGHLRIAGSRRMGLPSYRASSRAATAGSGCTPTIRTMRRRSGRCWARGHARK